VASYGYLSVDDDPQGWQAHGAVGAPVELLDWIARPGARGDRVYA
jgi:hypothetical protein